MASPTTRTRTFRYGAAVLSALLLALFTNGGGAVKNLGFHLGFYPKQREIRAVEQAVIDYNRVSAAFYNSGGERAGLDEIPAAPLLKRRLFQDINMLGDDGMVMVFDKDRFERREAVFLDRETALLVSREAWAVMFQDASTRKPLSAVKASLVSVRYLLHKEVHRTAGYAWIVQDCDVYPQDEEIPSLNVLPAL